MAAFQPANSSFGGIWEYVPAIVAAASKSPLGLASLFLLLLSLVALAYFRRAEWRVKAASFLVLILAGFGIFRAGVGAEVPTGVTPTGKVVDERGTPVLRARVTIESQDAPPVVYTDSEGIYRFNDYAVRPGVGLRITVSAEGFENYERNLPPDDTGRFEVIRLNRVKEPRPTATETPKPPREMVLMVKVLDEDGNPVANAKVTVEAEGSPPWKDEGITDTDGYSRFPNYPLRPAAGAKIIVRAEGFKLLTRHLPPGARGRIEEVRLTKAGSTSAHPPGG